jgi:hypothetical protein
MEPWLRDRDGPTRAGFLWIGLGLLVALMLVGGIILLTWWLLSQTTGAS